MDPEKTLKVFHSNFLPTFWMVRSVGIGSHLVFDEPTRERCFLLQDMTVSSSNSLDDPTWYRYLVGGRFLRLWWLPRGQPRFFRFGRRLGSGMCQGRHGLKNPWVFLVPKKPSNWNFNSKQKPLKMVGFSPSFSGAKMLVFWEGSFFLSGVVFVIIFHHQLGHLFISVYTPEI